MKEDIKKKKFNNFIGIVLSRLVETRIESVCKLTRLDSSLWCKLN